MRKQYARLASLIACIALSLAANAQKPDNRILLDRLGPPQATLFVSNADGSGERAITQPETRDYDPSWSGRGDWIVFTSERSGPANLYRIHPDGSGLEQLTNDPSYNDQAAFSPDGERIVFTSTRAAGRANLWILDVAHRKATQLTTGDGGDFRPSWSPDGKWIAFSSDRGSDLPAAQGRWERLQVADLYVVHPDGSGLRRVSEHGGFCGSPKWTQDSNSVVAYCMTAQETWDYRSGFQDGDDKLLKIDIATGLSTPVPAGQGVKMTPAVLPLGTIAYLRRDKKGNGIFYGTGTPGPAGADLHGPSWSPDGKQVVYSRFGYKYSSFLTKQWSRNKDFEIYSTAWLPAYDPTGGHIAVTMKTSDDSASLFVLDAQGTPKNILTRKGLILGPSWSPDGKQIVAGVGEFSAFLDFEIGSKKPVDPVNGGAQVAMVNADGSDFHLITSGPNNNAFASFAPDGKHIVYRTQGSDGAGLRIMNLEDHSVKVLTDGYANFPVWSPRGDLIAFMARVDGFFQICTIHPDGTDLKQLTHTRGNEAHMAWSPDGERIAFTSSRMGFKDEVLMTNDPQPYGEIFVMRNDGTQVEQLTDDQWEEGAPAWQPGKLDLSHVATARPAE